MRKWYSMLILTLVAKLTLANAGEEQEHSSPTGYLIIGALLLIVVIFILYNRQKRKFND